MEVKLIEIRDSATFIPAIAIRLRSRSPEELFLLRRAGYAEEPITQPIMEDNEPYVLLAKLDGLRAEYDPFAWGDRTMAVAHRSIIEHWSLIVSGEVVDVQFILGERVEPKLSERVTYGS